MADHPRTESEILERLLKVFSQLANRLPIQMISLDEKRRLGGHLFPRDLELIDETAVALNLRGDLYPDVQTTAAELLEAQRAAGAWLGLSVLFSTLSVLCLDNHV